MSNKEETAQMLKDLYYIENELRELDEDMFNFFALLKDNFLVDKMPIFYESLEKDYNSILTIEEELRRNIIPNVRSSL